jgi:hypothetical protein
MGYRIVTSWLWGLLVPGAIALTVALVVRRLSSRSFWAGLVFVVTIAMTILAVKQMGRPAMDGPLAVGGLLVLVPMATSLCVTRPLRTRPVAMVLATMACYAVIWFCCFNYGVNALLLGK